MSLAAGIVAGSKDIATTVLRRVRRHSLSSAQAAADARSKSGAPSRIWSKHHVLRISLRY